MLRDSGGDLPRFYARVKEIAKLSAPEREAKLAVVTGPIDAAPHKQ
jgi:predicted aminopeptidase